MLSPQNGPRDELQGGSRIVCGSKNEPTPHTPSPTLFGVLSSVPFKAPSAAFKVSIHPLSPPEGISTVDAFRRLLRVCDAAHAR